MKNAVPNWIRSFLLILFGQAASMIGSRMTRFALGIWVFTKTGSVAQFGAMLLFVSLPSIVVAPFLGVYIDRFPRKRILILCDSGAAASSILLAFFAYSGRLEMFLVYPIVFFSALFDSIRTPAFSAAIPMLAPIGQLDKANGMFSSADAIARILAPLFSGILLLQVGLTGIAVIDVATFIIAICTLLFIPFQETYGGSPSCNVKTSIVSETYQGLLYIKGKKGLFRLLQFFAAKNFFLGIFTVLFTPMVLAFGTSENLGVIMSVGSVGMLLGSLSVSLFGGPRHKVIGIFFLSAISGCAMVLSAVRPSVAISSFAIFIYLFLQPIVNSLSQYLFQKKTERRFQGRVFSIVYMGARLMEPVAYVVASLLIPLGTVVSQVFRNWPWIDLQNRPIAAVFVLLGVAVLGLVIISAFSRSLRRVETDLPDLI